MGDTTVYYKWKNSRTGKTHVIYKADDLLSGHYKLLCGSNNIFTKMTDEQMAEKYPKIVSLDEFYCTCYKCNENIHKKFK